MGGGNTIKSAWNNVATTKAYVGNFWSIQQSRKYGSPRNFLGGAGPRSSAVRLEKNCRSVPVLSRASRGTIATWRGAGCNARSLLQCGSMVSSKRNGPPRNYTPSDRSGAGFSLWGLVTRASHPGKINPHRLKPAPQDISDAAWLNKAAFTDDDTFSISDGECRFVNGPPKSATD